MESMKKLVDQLKSTIELIKEGKFFFFLIKFL